MKTKTQDPKFYIENGRLFGQSGLVPDDEPLFILRARDINALPTIVHYLKFAEERGADAEHLKAICLRIADFAAFKTEKPGRMKIPDTTIGQLHDGKP